jgi:hypothetical protein
VRCFRHHDRDAVGTCKACAKGLCVDCAVDLGHGLACRDSHEKAVAMLNTITDRATRVQATNTKARFAAPVFYSVLGALFLGWGVLSGFVFVSLLGGAFLIYAVVILAVNKRAFGPDKPDA